MRDPRAQQTWDGRRARPLGARGAAFCREPSRWRGLHGCLGLALIWGSWLQPSGQAAALSLDALAAHFAARGAGRVSELARMFAFEGSVSTRLQTLSRDGCVGYLAVGSRGVRDVDVGLYTMAGQPMVEDSGPSPYGYVRVCGAAGLAFYVTAAVFAGRGELTVVRVEGAPRAPGRLDELALAPSVGGKLQAQRQIGSEDSRAGELAGSLLREERRLSELGYVAQGPPRMLDVRAGIARAEVALKPRQCIRLSAMVPFSRGLVLSITGPDGRALTAKPSAQDEGWMGVCSRAAGRYAVRVHTRALRGLAILRVFAHPRARADLVDQLGPRGVLGLAEAEQVAATRGMALRHVGNGWVERAHPLSWPIELGGGRCYGLFALAMDPVQLEMRLLDERGGLLALDEGRRGLPALFTCPQRDLRARLVLRGGAPDGLVGIWLARGGDG